MFHQNAGKAWQPTVRPPRLGGNEKIGVFASRSGFRPNPIGMSVVPLQKIEHAQHATYLHVSGLDLIEGTPVLDVKPYVPYVDRVEDAHAGYAQSAPVSPLKVTFSDQAAMQCTAKAQVLAFPKLRQLIVEILQADPRPAYYNNKHEDKIQGLRLFDFDLKWRVTQDCADVISLD